MSIMPRLGLIFDMGGVNGDSTRFLLRRFVDLRVVRELSTTVLRKNLRNGSRQSGLSVIDMSCKRDEHAGQGGEIEKFVPIVPMFMCGLAREYFWAATGSAYPLRMTAKR